MPVYFVDLFFFDLPYGITGESWDNLIPEAELVNILTQLEAVQAAKSWVVAFMADWRQLHLVSNALSAKNYTSIDPIVWYKENQNVAGPAENLTFACEFIVMARHGGGAASKFQLPKDPLHRHNIIKGPTNRKYLLGPDGQKVNSTEKPPYVSRWFYDRFVKPGGTVLICGTGAGGEVRSAIQAGLTVFGVDADITQTEQLYINMQTYEEVLRIESDKKAKEDAKKEGESGDGAAAAEELETGICVQCGVSMKDDDSCVGCDVCMCPIHEACSKASEKSSSKFMCKAATNCKPAAEASNA